MGAACESAEVFTRRKRAEGPKGAGGEQPNKDVDSILRQKCVDEFTTPQSRFAGQLP